jgi:hypothetical protein
MYIVFLSKVYFKHSLGRNHLTGTIPTELGSIKSLSSLSLQFNDLSGTIPVLKNLVQLKALQVEGNDRLVGTIGPHNLLCQMRPKCKLSSQRWAFVMLQIHITYNSLHTTPFIKQYLKIMDLRHWIKNNTLDKECWEFSLHLVFLRQAVF